MKIDIDEYSLARKVFLWFTIIWISGSWLSMVHERAVETGYQQYGVTPLVDILMWIIEISFVIIWFVMYLFFEYAEIVYKKQIKLNKKKASK